ncbi:MAG TPA: ABC transporter substrate binding protein [Desulfuromonadaceae bacterium]
MTKCVTTFLFAALLAWPCPFRCDAAEVMIVADTRLKPVAEIVAGLRKVLNTSLKIYSPDDVRGAALQRMVEREGARVVIALGREALGEALRLPPSVPMIYDMVVTPPATTRPNTAGFYMATPAREYVNLANAYLHSIRKIAVVGSREQLGILAADTAPQTVSYNVRNAFELVSTLRQIETANAIMLLPDASLLTTAAMEQAYLLSFRRGIPLLGISERQVREGALLALVVDAPQVGKQIGEYAARALKTGTVGQPSPAPPRRFDLYVNTDTARRMGIRLPDELLRSAKRVYP